MPRFIARVVSISESQRSKYRVVQLEPWSPEQTPGKFDPEACSPFAHGHMLLSHGTHVELPARDADQMRPGQFVGLDVTPITTAEAEAIAADAKERMVRLKAQCAYAVTGVVPNIPNIQNI